MPDLQVNVRVSDEHFRAYQAEARRRGVPVEALIQQTVNCLMEELEAEENECRDALRTHPATPHEAR
jgi:hypothetical protein